MRDAPMTHCMENRSSFLFDRIAECQRLMLHLEFSGVFGGLVIGLVSVGESAYK